VEHTKNTNQIGRGRALRCQCAILVIHGSADDVVTATEKQIHQLVMVAVGQMYEENNHRMKMLGKPDDTGAIGGPYLAAASTCFDLSSIGTMITAPLSEAMTSQA
jgi:hypothetical protein